MPEPMPELLPPEPMLLHLLVSFRLRLPLRLPYSEFLILNSQFSIPINCWGQRNFVFLASCQQIAEKSLQIAEKRMQKTGSFAQPFIRIES
jgi:hypothetical protein